MTATTDIREAIPIFAGLVLPRSWREAWQKADQITTVQPCPKVLRIADLPCRFSMGYTLKEEIGVRAEKIFSIRL